MPIIKSAKKRVRVAKKAAVRNHKTKRSLKEALKLFSKKPSSESHSKAQSAIGKAAKKHVIHKNKAARQQRQLAAKAKASAAAKPVKKTAAKKTTKPTTKRTTKK